MHCLTHTLSSFYERVFNEKFIQQFKNCIILIGIIALIAHLILIAINRNFSGIPDILKIKDAYYLSAIHTPFSFILFFEVFLLIVSIPKSLTISIAKQYEIVSLIIIRNVFKDIGALESATNWSSEIYNKLSPVLLDLAGGIIMFFLVTLFHRIIHKNFIHKTDKRINHYVEIKKSISLFLCFLLFFMALYSGLQWISHITSGINFTGIYFYDGLFTVMIFADVLILLFSLIYISDYELVFRDAGFIISTILIRFSLTTPRPYDIVLGIGAMICGILILLIYNYFSFIHYGLDQED
ncbi:MAG: hypothetical protein WCO06_05425 [Candidatus Roizmanbacteria bacterium]